MSAIETAGRDTRVRVTILTGHRGGGMNDALASLSAVMCAHRRGIPNVRRFLIGLVLTVSLLCAQFMLVEHGLEHAFHDHDEVCIECLALPGMQAVPKQAAHLCVPPPTAFAVCCAVPKAPNFELRLAFRTRAPPALLS